jgi:riboflavin kinase, archaea type
MQPKANVEIAGIKIVGSVKFGLGRGKYFVSLPQYKRQFIKKLGINPYHGTLNLKLSKKNEKLVMKIKERKGILIRGFSKGEKKFGDVVCYMADIKGIKCALVMPKLSTHVAVAEIISTKMLRTALKLKEADKVKFTVKA